MHNVVRQRDGTNSIPGDVHGESSSVRLCVNYKAAASGKEHASGHRHRGCHCCTEYVSVSTVVFLKKESVLRGGTCPGVLCGFA